MDTVVLECRNSWGGVGGGGGLLGREQQNMPNMPLHHGLVTPKLAK